MESRRQQWIFVRISLTAIVIGLAGCSAGPNADLARARTSLQQATQTPGITEYAPVQLREAQQTYDQAEQNWEEEGDREETSHRAYLVEQQAGIAVALAQQKAAEAQAKQLAEQRDQVRLSARTREAEQAHLEAQEAKTRAQQLEQELAALNAKDTDRGLVMTLDPTLFEFNKTTLKPGAMNNLYPLVTFLRERPERRVSIEGHTDSVGSDSYNLDLSQRRADAVRDFLVRNGVQPEQITTRGYGKSFPIASNDTEAGRLQNRRVEIVISHGSERIVDRQLR
jgi:outer membrane protein OmpA-like peptidoglycan-associated protein